MLSIPLWSDFIFRTRFISRTESTRFQSHYGLILSEWLLCWWVENRFTFNPTMVWFYLPVLLKLSSVDIIFQSHYGLILSGWRTDILNFHNKKLSIPLWSDFIDGTNTQSHSFNSSFNPTMVWFYHICVPTHKTTYRGLSIPLWSDFIRISIHHRGDYEDLLSLSIPLWSDFISDLQPDHKTHLQLLSIPLWSDFIKVNPNTFDVLVLDFQSHYGLILS